MQKSVSPSTLLVLFGCLLGLFSAAPGLAGTVESDAVSLEAPAAEVRAGETTTFPVQLTVKDGYHVMANPASESFYVPTTLEAAETSFGFEVRYPEGTEYNLTPGMPPVRVYGGATTLTATLTAPADAEAGAKTIPLTLRYQACTESQCRPPETISTTLDVTVRPVGAAPPAEVGEPAPAREETQAATEKAPGQGGEGASFALAREHGLVWLMGIVFLGGLALNLTPCVLPLLPVTMGFFASQGEHRPGRTFPLALVYVLALAAVFTVLGGAAASLGSLLGAALQSMYGRVALALLMVVLAASLFGAFDFHAPGRLLAGLQGKSGLIGAAITGAAMGLVAAPCVGPFVSGLVAYVAKLGDRFLGALLFFLLALGLGVPYLFLGVFTGLINRVPRGGPYLVWFRRLLAFPLLALVVYFLRASLPVWMVWALYAAVALAGAVYLGILEGWSLRPWSNRFAVARVATAMVLAALAVAMVSRRVLPAFGYGPGAASAAGLEENRGGQVLNWQPYAPGDLAGAAAEGKPAVLYFTAEWCTYCRTMEHTVFRGREVQRAARGAALLKVDLTDRDALGDEVRRLQRKYVHGGPPAIVFFDSRGREVARRNKIDRETFLDLLARITR